MRQSLEVVTKQSTVLEVYVEDVRSAFGGRVGQLLWVKRVNS